LPPFWIIDSTLREGEQFATADFTTDDRMYIAMNLDKMGVDYIELANPAASETAYQDLSKIASLGLQAKILTHTRCAMNDVKLAVDSGVDGVNVYMATSPILAEHSHGKAIHEIIKIAEEVINYVKDAGKEIRFSCEDTFRSNIDDALLIYKSVGELGVNRIGIADTVGIATPMQVQDIVGRVREVLDPSVGIEFHTHNDVGGCISNALVALHAGATHIDTCVLGIGERNGITPLGGFLARMYTLDQEAIQSRYNLRLLAHLEKYVAQVADITIPFNNFVTGSCAFTHKAGVHTKAVISNPKAYEILDPEDFGVSRRVQLVHRLTGWNVMAARAQELNLNIPTDKLKVMTQTLKNLSDERQFSTEELDRILINLAAGSREHGTFVTIGDQAEKAADPIQAKINADTLAEEVTKAVDLSVRESGSDQQEVTMPFAILQCVGHLFDKMIVNSIIDLAVDSPCDYKVMSINPAQKNESLSSITVKVMHQEEEEIERLKNQMSALVKVHEGAADCVLLELAKFSARPTIHNKYLQVSGHLFDKPMFNKILDVLSVSNVDFEVQTMQVGANDDAVSVCVLKVSHTKKELLSKVVTLIQRVVAELEGSMTEISSVEPPPLQDRGDYSYVVA
jgi:homocitrate synthase